MKYNMNCRKMSVLGIIALLLLNQQAFSQESTDSDEIALPDLTTVVTGNETKTSENLIPDFSDVIEYNAPDGMIVPQLPEISIENSSENIYQGESDEQKKIFAEGQIAGGFPGIFKGDFSLQRLSGDNPFAIAFSHNASDSYSGHSLSTGYNSSETKMDISKTVSYNNMSWLFGTNYNFTSDGLQSKSENFTDLNHRNISAFCNYDWNFPKGFVVSADVKGAYNTTFSDVIPSASLAEDRNWLSNRVFINVMPVLSAQWANDNINTGISGQYSLDALNTDSRVINRGEFTGNFTWHNDTISAGGDVGIAFGDGFATSFLVPFNLGIKASVPVYFSNRKLSIGASGGLLSTPTDAAALENKYKFTALSYVPGEESDWFGKIDISVPLKYSVSIMGNAEYRHTAGDNGVFSPVYDDSSRLSGIYGFEQKSRQILKTNLEFAFHYKLFSLSVRWFSNWITVPVLENAQNFALSLSFQDDEARWAGRLSCIYSMDAADVVPVVDVEAFVRLNNAVRLILSVEDAVKLFSGAERIYAGDYITRSGNASLAVKFYF